MTPADFLAAVGRHWTWPLLAGALGAAGAGCGVIGVVLFLSRRPSALAWALLALVGATASAAVGMAAMPRQVAKVDQEFRGVGPAQLARWRRLVFAEARQAPLVGFGASLLPLLLGALAALGAARGRRGALAGSAALLAAAGAACLGALLLSRTPTPEDGYGFPDDDGAAWNLAIALEAASADPASGCNLLEVALQPYWAPADRLEWPRQLRRQPPASLSGWRAAADGCVRAVLDHRQLGAAARAPRGVRLSAAWPPEALLASPLLQDEALRAQVQAVVSPGLAARPPHLDRDAIKAVVSAHQPELRLCYELALANEPTLAGRLVVRFTIGPDGAVSEANSDGSFPSAAVAQCALARFRAMAFPPPEDGAPVEVSTPFVFKPAGP